MVRVVTACVAGMNMARMVQRSIETEMARRGYELRCDVWAIGELTRELFARYDLYARIVALELGFRPMIPIVDASPILFGAGTRAKPVFDEVERLIRERGLT